MGQATSAELVAELQRRLANLSDAHALAALNRAQRWVTRQSSFQFLTQSTTILPVETASAAPVDVTGVLSITFNDALATWVSGGLFNTDGTWAPLVGPFPPTPTGNSSLDIVIGTRTLPMYWVQDTTHLVTLGVWPDATGDYTFTVVVGGPSTSPGPGAFDPGKAKTVLNPDGSPVQHVALSDFWQSYNYNLPTSTNYDVYTIVSDNTTDPPTNTFLFFPPQPGFVTLYYHRTTTDMLGGSDLTAFPKDFDDLLVDLAEAEERRIYDVGDSWQLLLARSQDQIKVLLDGYRSMTQQAASLQDAQTKQTEVTQLGRS